MRICLYVRDGALPLILMVLHLFLTRTSTRPCFLTTIKPLIPTRPATDAFQADGVQSTSSSGQHGSCSKCLHPEGGPAAIYEETTTGG